MTNHDLVYEWEGYGLRFHVPQDSLPAKYSQCTVMIKASLFGQYEFPADCELVSGIFWIYCPVKFSNHVTLELEYNSSSREGLQFLRAECTQKELPYTFEQLEGGKFSEHCNYGCIRLLRFSGFAVGSWIKSILNLNNRPNYNVHIHYAEDQRTNMCQVMFAILCAAGLKLEERVGSCMHVCLYVAVAV